MRAYFSSDAQRRVQVALGLLWLLDGGLQFQSFMYSHAFPASLVANAAGQPVWLHASILWGARIANGDLGMWNTLFALTQVALGLGLLWRPTVRIAILASLGWVLVVWWLGEGFGMLLMNMAQPLTGAPGGVLLYGLVAVVCWPGRPGGLAGPRGARAIWGALWLLMAVLWLTGPGSDPNAVHDAILTTDSGIGAVASLQRHVAAAAAGHGLVIALVLCALSAAIGIAVWADSPRARRLLEVSIILNLLYWVLGQGVGGLFAGGATDPNAGPLFILLACAVWPCTRPSGAAAPAPSDPLVGRVRRVKDGFAALRGPTPDRL